MGVDAVLVQPRAGHWEKLGLRQPESLLTVAAVPFSRGLNLRILDTRLSNRWKEQLGRILAHDKPLCVGITSMTGVQIRHALEVSQFVKEHSPVPVIWGGVHASLLPEQTLENKYIDAVVIGEGDYAFYEIIEALKKGRSLKGIKGVYFKEKGEIVKNEKRELVKDLDELPPLPYHLIDMDAYYSMNTGEGRSTTMTTSRGCPNRCTFCYNTAFYCNRWRAMSAGKVIERLKFLVDRYRIKTVFFHDDNFSVDLARVDAITKGMLREGLDISWGLLGTRADTIERMNDNLLRQVVKAGCINIDVGVESGSDRMLKLIKKDITIPRIIAINRRLAQFSIISKYTFVVGFPSETKKEMQQSVNLALKLTRENPHAYTPFFILILFPGTEIFNLGTRFGYKEPEKLGDWVKCNSENSYLFYPWLTKEKISIIRNLEFTSNFANKNIKYKINSKLIHLLFDAYYPIARFRFSKGFHQLPLERAVVQYVLK